MRVLFTPLGEIGHVNPHVGICQRLARDGHEVAFHCWRSFAALFARAGVDVAWFGEIPSARGVTPQGLAARMRDRRWLEHWYRLAVAKAEPAIAGIEATLAAFRPDIVVIDPNHVAAAIAVERARLPWAAISTNFISVRPHGWGCPFVDVGSRLMPTLEVLARSLGVTLTFDAINVVSPWLNTVFTIERFAARADPKARFVGPARVEGARGDEPEFPWDRLDDRPLIYVSSGGGQALAFDAVQMQRIARSVDHDAVAMVIASQALERDPEFRAALPPQVIVVGYAPQRQLLERAAVAVTHGGVNTVNECLDAGCPILVLPLGMEQPLQAELVTRAGVGLTLDPFAMTDDECRGALHQLQTGDHRADARAMRDAYRDTDSTGQICAALTELAAASR